MARPALDLHRHGGGLRRARQHRPAGTPFGAHTTLGYSENSSDTGGILSVKDGTHIAKLALLGNYMAASFVTASDGYGGTLITEGGQTAQQSLLTHPHA